jgi:hypothetical protein
VSHSPEYTKVERPFIEQWRGTGWAYLAGDTSVPHPVTYCWIDCGRLCSASVGKLMLQKLRRDAEAEQGAEFSLLAFHDAFLGHGAPPFPILRPRLLREDDGRVV